MEDLLRKSDDVPLQNDWLTLFVDEDKHSSHLGYCWPVEFTAAELDEAHITRLWDNCQPFVVKNAILLMTPQSFISGALEAKTCTVSFLDRDRWIDTQGTLDGFFNSWRNGSKKVLQVRVSMREP